MNLNEHTTSYLFPCGKAARLHEIERARLYASSRTGPESVGRIHAIINSTLDGATSTWILNTEGKTVRGFPTSLEDFPYINTFESVLPRDFDGGLKDFIVTELAHKKVKPLGWN